MPRLGIDREFLRDFARLERRVQDRITDVFTKFEAATHAGVHLEKIANVRDDRFRSIRIDQSYRGIVLAPDQGDTYTLLKVLPHDDAYAWAQRRRASVNGVTGRIEIRDVEAIDKTLPQLKEAAGHVGLRLFAHIKSGDLLKLGVDQEIREFASVLTDVAQLEAARTFLPQHQWEALYGLAAGLTPEEVWSELGPPPEPDAIDPDDVIAAVERTSERVLLVDGAEELLAVLRRPLEFWRVYLHPSQRRLVTASYSGPARVTGGPGTGKTVVALHRARELARRGAGRVLVTTFTSTLATTLQATLDLLVDDLQVRDRITVQHVDQLAHHVVRRKLGAPRMLSSRDELRRWQAIGRELRLPLSATFLSEEWRQVILAQQLGDLEEYLAARRVGRGRPLSRRQRAGVWEAVLRFQRGLLAAGMWTHETVRAEAAAQLAAGDPLFRHVIVDEAQDLSPDQWRLLRAAVGVAPDDIFIAGDSHQRIYQHRISLKDVSVYVSGRSARLTINYRTTAEILAWSLRILSDQSIDDMDGGMDSVAGYRCETHGESPELVGFGDRTAERRALVDKLRHWLEAGVRPSEIGIAARSNAVADDVTAELRNADIKAYSLMNPGPRPSGVAVGTMHRMKGLEFRCVAAIGVSDSQVPPASAITPADDDHATHLQDLQRERCLLFVACTRARERLYVSWHGAPSSFIV
ncbi:UvrD-helicase domain-containing protein [Kribbella sp. NPDC049227]|uniref:UvrD-helicase domain-containing protein n=1 Tax=Kribbella sp. NPDC049227 TaxID=3364113 RepID=UPI003712C70F